MRTGYWILNTEYCESRRASIKDSVNQCSVGTRQQGFTLIELLVVVAIMAIVMTISVPFMNNAINSPKGINGAVRQVQETSKMARDWAILKQTPHQLRIRPGEGIFEVQAGGGGGSRMPGRLESRNLAGDEWRMPDRPATPVAGSGGGGIAPVKLPDGVIIEAILANGVDATEEEMAFVTFRADGTCDELNLVLYRAETNERRQVWLEVTTGLADIESDPSKFRLH